MSYFKLLCDINKFICHDLFQVRKNNIGYIAVIDKEIIKTLMLKNDKCEYIKSAIRVASLIKLYQLFYDGNHRTAVVMFGLLIHNIGYSFDFDKALQDVRDHKLNIPTIYDIDDAIAEHVDLENYIIENKKNIKLL